MKRTLSRLLSYRPTTETFITTATLATIFVIWIEITRREMVPEIFVPAPATVWDTFVELMTEGYHGHNLMQHNLVSLERVMVGWVAATLISVPLGLAMGLSSKVRAGFDFLIEFYRPLPPLAYYTLLVLWFGIGETSKVLLLFLAAMPPIIIGCGQAVRDISPSVTQAARSLGASPLQVFYKITLPATMPGTITSMRISLGFTYTVLVAAEIVAATEGIGWLVWDAAKFLRSDVIFVGIIVMGVTGIFLDAILRIIAKYVLRWKYG